MALVQEGANNSLCGPYLNFVRSFGLYFHYITSWNHISHLIESDRIEFGPNFYSNTILNELNDYLAGRTKGLIFPYLDRGPTPALEVVNNELMTAALYFYIKKLYWYNLWMSHSWKNKTWLPRNKSNYEKIDAVFCWSIKPT